MNGDRDVWQLFDGGQLLGKCVVTGSEFPWLNATFEPTDAFAAWRAIFAEELRLLDNIDDHVQQWEGIYRRITDTLTLRNPAGQPVAEFLLHIEGDAAWWRWSDEPFPPDTGEDDPR